MKIRMIAMFWNKILLIMSDMKKTELYPQKDKVILFPKFGEYDLVLNPDII